MSTPQPQHLKSGSECPPLKENQLRLYSMRFCPFVQRAKLVLAAKNIPFEEVRINLSDRPEWYLKKNPVGEVPLLEWIDPDTKQVRAIPESLVVCDYLENKYPQPALYPTDPYVRAQQQVLVGRFGNVQSAFYQFLGGNSENAVKELNEQLAAYEEQLQDTYFGGSQPAMVDYMLWPWFGYFPALADKGFVLNSDGKLPKLAAWCQAMRANQAVQKLGLSDDLIKRFMASRKEGNANYDVE